MQIEIDPFAKLKEHLKKHKEAYVSGLLGLVIGLLLRRPIVIQNNIVR